MAEAFLYKASMKKVWEQVKAHFKNVWPSVQVEILKQLKGHIVKLALKTFLKSGAGAGFNAWLVKFVVEELFEEVAEPIIKMGFTFMGYIYHRDIDGNILIKRLKDARTNGTDQEYVDAVNDIMS